MSIVSNVQLQGNANVAISVSTLALGGGDSISYSNIADITIDNISPSEMMILYRCAIIERIPSDDVIYSLTKEALKKSPKMPQMTSCRLIRCKLPKAFYEECVFINKEGARIIGVVEKKK